MNTPDARLNAAERAAFADLEAAACAADPALAARLRAGSRGRVLPVLRSFRLRARRAWSLLLGSGWWGLAPALAGLALMLLGLAAGMAISLAGAVLTTAGMRVLAEMLVARLARSSASRRGRNRRASAS